MLRQDLGKYLEEERKFRARSILKKSQGGFFSFFFVIVILLTFALFFVVLHKTWAEIKQPLNEGLSSAMPTDSSVNISKTIDSTTSTTSFFDKLYPFLIIGVFAFVLIVAGSIMDHPIMIVVGVIIIAVVILLSVIYSNLYNSITETDEFSETKSALPIQDKFMKYMPFIVFIMALGIVGAIVWSKKGGGSSYL